MINYFVISNTGYVRTQNEDAHYHDTGEAPMIFAIFDGMGGLQNGRVAAQMAVEQLDACKFDIKRAKSPDEIDAVVQKYVEAANRKICAQMKELAVRMGTTLALAVVTKDFIKAYNIGDSRIYLLCDGKFSQISEEHTLAEQKVQLGMLTAEEAKHHPDRHKLTRHLGVFEDEMAISAAVLDPIPIDGENRLLLCTDGLTDMVDDDRIEEILRRESDAKKAAERLIDEALANGGMDNVTCVVVDVAPGQAKTGVNRG